MADSVDNLLDYLYGKSRASFDKRKKASEEGAAVFSPLHEIQKLTAIKEPNVTQEPNAISEANTINTPSKTQIRPVLQENETIITDKTGKIVSSTPGSSTPASSTAGAAVGQLAVPTPAPEKTREQKAIDELYDMITKKEIPPKETQPGTVPALEKSAIATPTPAPKTQEELKAPAATPPGQEQKPTQPLKNPEEVKPLSAPVQKKAEEQSVLPTEELDNILEVVPENSRDAASKSIPLIAKALKDEGILTPNVLSYALATTQWETDHTFQPIEEYGGAQQAVKLGYSGGENFYGRGFIQLTHDYNYQKMGERIGLGDALVKTPAKALEPQTSAKILAAYFKDNGVAQLAEQGDFYGARSPVNGTDRAYEIAEMARKFLNNILRRK